MASPTLVERARALAHKAHEGQFRPNKSRRPLSEHTDETAELIRLAGGTKYQIAAGHLHDSLEDTTLTERDIVRECRRGGGRVARIVVELTDKPEIKGLPTWARKIAQARRLLNKSDGVKLCKLADTISNLRSLAGDPPHKDRATNVKRLQWIHGAAVVASVCSGISSVLDVEFHKAYQKAMTVYWEYGR